MEYQSATKDSKSDPQQTSVQSSKAADSANAFGLLHVQRAVGNHAFGRFLQAKLTVSEPSDEYEQEADRVADQVMRTPDPNGEEPPEISRASDSALHRACNKCEEEDEIGIQRKLDDEPEEETEEPDVNLQRACNKCEEDEEKVGIHRKAVDDTDRSTETKGSFGRAGSLVQEQIDNLSSDGEPLTTATRAYFESYFGSDFSDVRVHHGKRAFESAQSVNALAYTIGPHVVFGSGQYAPDTAAGKRLLAHELTHVVQQRGVRERSVDHQPGDSGHGPASHDTPPAAPQIQRSPVNILQRAAGDAAGGAAGGAAGAPAAGGNAGGGPPGPAVNGFEVDVLAAEAPDDFLMRAAARALGVDLRVSSLDDLINQVETRTRAGTCVRRLNIFNHANPSYQQVSGGNKRKSEAGEVTHTPSSGFSINWLTSNANQAALNRLRHTLCCDSQMNWFGCSTAGVWAEGGTRTAAERAQSEKRFTGTFGDFYHDVTDAAAHGATNFRYIGMVNVQSWANALCTPVLAATDFTNWRTVGSEVVRTVIYGGRQVRLLPQADIACACDPVTGRRSGSAQTAAQLQQRSDELRQEFLRPLYEQTRSPIGTTQPEQAESEAERNARVASEQAQAAESQQLGNTIRDTVLANAGFAAGARPTTADEALRVVALWNLDIDKIARGLPPLTTALSGMLRGSHEESTLDQTQRAFEAALTQKGRENFMGALMLVRREPFWNDYLSRNTVYIFPDLTGVNRYRGYTQVATRTVPGSKPQKVFVIHVSKDLLEYVPVNPNEPPQTELVAANIVHELSHTIETNRIGQAMEAFEENLAGLIADHPRLVALRAGATDAAAARSIHVSKLRQMLYEATGYAEEEIFVHLQQLTHQPSMTINRTAVRGSDFVLHEVERFMRQLKRIGLPPRLVVEVLAAIRRQTGALYDRRIAAAPAGSEQRRMLELNKTLALSTFDLALDFSQTPPSP